MSASPGEAITSSNRLSELSRVEAAERGRAGAVCLLPVGSLEQHGEHLPVGTDSLLVETVSLRAAGLARADAIVAPTVWTGLSPHHVRLGVTVTLEPELLIELTRQIVRCLRPWFRDVVIVNGHGGNRGWLGAFALTEECLPDMGASGVLGDPAAASPAAGERFVDTAAHGLAELLDALASPDTEESRP
jgi:creatinine amidohydrolase/Fe(II)-dependent formamide hydrolase-like protein